MGPADYVSILSKGAHFPDCRHLASTFSASTIATLATGAWPAQHGIVADSWYDRAVRGPVRASQEALLATTLTAQVAAEQRDMRAFVIGMDATHSALFAGTPDARQFWMDRRGQFTTLGEPPKWLVEYNALRPLDNYHNAQWMAVRARSPVHRPCAPSPMTRTIRSGSWICSRRRLRTGRAVRIALPA